MQEKQVFERHARRMLERAIDEISPESSGDIYALSFFVYDLDDDPRRPTLTLGFNTVEHWRKSVERASSADEAKWNYAFWLQNALCEVGEEGTESASLRQAWMEALGLAYTDAEEEADFERCLELGSRFTPHFLRLAVEAANWLHESGVVVRKFGSAIPIIVHELEYYDEIAEQTIAANPTGIATVFADWVHGLS